MSVTCITLSPDENVNAYTHLNSKNVMGCSGKAGVFPYITAQVQNVNFVKVAPQMLTYAIGCYGFDESIVSD